jgi:hypothetical protein
MDPTIDPSNTIRIMINYGPGFGHQTAAITLMRKLRALGFTGLFDVRYMGENVVGHKLETLFVGFNMTSANSGVEMLSSMVGRIKITKYSKDNLPQVYLTMTPAYDEFRGINPAYYHCEGYVILQPTDWLRPRIIALLADRGEEVERVHMPMDARLSAESLPPIDSTVVSSPIESKIIALCKNTACDSQLLYCFGHPDIAKSWCASAEDTSAAYHERILRELIRAHRKIQSSVTYEGMKRKILFLPQSTHDLQVFKKIADPEENIYFFDLSEGETPNVEALSTNAIILVHTGKLNPQLFAHLMIGLTNFPPVIEGCNAREACEHRGWPFIHGGAKELDDNGLKLYSLPDAYLASQELHQRASRCLMQAYEPGDERALKEYMQQCLVRDPTLMAYHQARQAAFLARPDIVDLAITVLREKGSENIKRLISSFMPVPSVAAETSPPALALAFSGATSGACVAVSAAPGS